MRFLNHEIHPKGGPERSQIEPKLDPSKHIAFQKCTTFGAVRVEHRTYIFSALPSEDNHYCS